MGWGHIVCWGSALVIVVVTIATIPLLNTIIRRKVVQRVMLVNGSEVYDEWLKPTMPIYLQVYVFDLKNPVGVLDGEKPFLKQRGPYTYREEREKVDLVDNKNGTVTYRQIKTWHFDRNQSVGDDSDTFTTINMALNTLLSSLNSSAPWKQSLTSELVKLVEKNLFDNYSVRDIVFGYEDKLLKLGKILYPSMFYTDVIGILAGKNNTDDGVYTVVTGQDDFYKLGEITHYNGSRYLPFWSTSYANMVNGSVDSYNIPVVSSFPNFFMADPSVLDNVEGLMPIPHQHATEIDIEPTTGIVMKIAKRLQINMYVESSPSISQTAKVRTMFYPILWMNESSEIDKAHADKVKWELLVPQLVAKIIQYAVIAAGALVMLGVLILVRCPARPAVLIEAPDNEDDGAGLLINEERPSVNQDEPEAYRTDQYAQMTPKVLEPPIHTQDDSNPENDRNSPTGSENPQDNGVHHTPGNNDPNSPGNSQVDSTPENDTEGTKDSEVHGSPKENGQDSN